jgi:hypothetical protein
MKTLWSVSIILALTFAPSLSAQIPQSITYQGVLVTGGQPVDGTVAMTVRLFPQSTGGIAAWSGTYPAVTVNKGVFSVLLDVSGLAFDKPYYVETEINGSVSPVRAPLASAPYSLGPWQSNDNNVNFVAGNVGIGVSNPTFKLDVLGNMRLNSPVSNDLTVQTTGGTNAWARMMLQTTNQKWTLGTSQNFNGDQFYLVDDSHGLWRMMIQPNGGEIAFPNTVSNSLVVQTSGGTNAWAKFAIRTTNQTWSLGSSQNFNGDQFYLTDETHGGYPRMTIQPNGGGIVFPNNVSNSLGVQTSGGTNAWAKFYLRTINHTWDIGTSQNFNGDQLYFADATNGGVIRMCIMPSGNVGIGTTNPATALEVIGRTRTGSLEITGGSDLAEPFQTRDGADAEPGTVMVLDEDHPGELTISNEAYDHKVAGIISGAGGVKPGITLQQTGVTEGKHMVAMAGRVYCKAEAMSSPIKTGDLLTTSLLKGHAMKASDPERSRGAVIGKAITPLREGTGLILVLVNLQ